MAENQPGRKSGKNDASVARDLLSTGIIILSTVAGWALGSIISVTASFAGGFAGFLIGLIIVMTVALARTK